MILDKLMTKVDNNKLHNIDEIIEALQSIKQKYGNLLVAEIFYNGDYPTEVESILPCVVTNPLNKKEYLVIFD